MRRQAELREAFERIDPEPVIALLEPMVEERRKRRILDVLEARLASVRLVMDGPHDPHNGAAVLRSCDAFGVYHVHVVERHERFLASNAVSKGAERWVDVIGHATSGEAVAALAGFTLVATHPRGALRADELGGIAKLALVLGNEHDGISAELERACTHSVRVPMRGFVESLNLSVTAAILLSHATAGRLGDVPEDERRRLYARALAVTVPRGVEILAARGIELPSASGVAPGEQLAVPPAKQ